MAESLSDLPVRGRATGTEWDSIVHTSFRLAEGFSKRKLTAEGLDAIDAIPVLHMCVGDVVVDTIGDGSLRSCFCREWIDRIRFSNKNQLSQTLASSTKISHYRPTFRASKQQNMVDFMSGFGG